MHVHHCFTSQLAVYLVQIDVITLERNMDTVETGQIKFNLSNEGTIETLQKKYTTYPSNFKVDIL